MDVILPLIALVAFSLKGKADTAKELEFFPKSLALSNDKKTLWLITDILNPTKRALTIDSLFLKVDVGSVNVGAIEKTVPFVIQKTGRTMVKFPVRVNPVGLGKLIAYILKGNSPTFTVKGTGESGGIKFPVFAKIPLT